MYPPRKSSKTEYASHRSNTTNRMLVMLTQDDCIHTAFCRTWAVIHGKPVSDSNPFRLASAGAHQLLYDAHQLLNGDLPPNIITAQKTLGCTDGCGNETRFSFTTTIRARKKNG